MVGLLFGWIGVLVRWCVVCCRLILLMFCCLVLMVIVLRWWLFVVLLKFVRLLMDIGWFGLVMMVVCWWLYCIGFWLMCCGLVWLLVICSLCCWCYGWCLS